MVLGLLATLAAALSLSAPIGYGFLGRMEAPTGRTLGSLPASVAPSAFRRDESQLQILHGILRGENRSSNSVDQPALPAGGHLGTTGTAFLSPTCSRFDLRFVDFPSNGSILVDLHPAVVPNAEHNIGNLSRWLHSSGTRWSMEHALPNSVRPSSPSFVTRTILFLSSPKLCHAAHPCPRPLCGGSGRSWLQMTLRRGSSRTGCTRRSLDSPLASCSSARVSGAHIWGGTARRRERP